MSWLAEFSDLLFRVSTLVVSYSFLIHLITHRKYHA